MSFVNQTGKNKQSGLYLKKTQKQKANEIWVREIG